MSPFCFLKQSMLVCFGIYLFFIGGEKCKVFVCGCVCLTADGVLYVRLRLRPEQARLCMYLVKILSLFSRIRVDFVLRYLGSTVRHVSSKNRFHHGHWKFLDMCITKTSVQSMQVTSFKCEQKNCTFNKEVMKRK